ncbi:UTRA domain-containing protein [endosymbiont 'TC1' of Trimyema compressum]|uniref:UTRA domain-containing protein n=1 Tax=endosymbiont 'TC1' of Trimyema compressum TaxID=243899 RepID=UPI0013923F4B
MPSLVDKELAKLFNKEEKEPCLLIESIIYNLDNQPLIYSKEYYNNEIIQFSEIRVNNFIRP